MAKHVKHNRMSTALAAVYIGPEGEIIVDTGTFSIRVQDGVTPGGNLVGPTATLWSSALVFAYGAKMTWNHGLAVDPFVLPRAMISCISAQANYAIGDKIELSHYIEQSNGRGLTLGNDADGNTVFCIMSGGNLYIADKTTFALTGVDVTKWRLYLGISR